MEAQYRIILFAWLVALISCQRNSRPVGDTSRNALDWQGTYYGILPCADCRGILTMIQLNEDNTFNMSTSYLGKTGVGQKKTGSFSWDEKGREITLEGLSDATPPVYKVGEDRLIPVHHSIAEARAVQYSLTKGSSEITNRYWKLIKVDGRQVRSNEGRGKEPHLILLSTDSTVIGNGSCNNFRGTYRMTADNGLSFSPLAATKMACMDNMDVENQFLKALWEVRRYEISVDSLILSNDQRSKSVTLVLGHL